MKKQENLIEEKIEKTTTKRDLGEENKREKKMSSAQKAFPVLLVICIALTIILVAVLIAFYRLKATDEQSSKTLDSIYASSYYSMVDSVNNLQVNADKFETLTTSSSQRAILKDMEEDCTYIVAGLSVLPIDAQNSMSAIKFFNQISGMCEAYIKTLDEGGQLSVKQLVLIDKAEYALSVIKSRLNTHNDMVRNSNYEFISVGVFDDEGVTQFSTSLGDLTANEIDYPSMIFDGPFSSALENKEIKGLSAEEITEEQAKQYVKDIVFEGEDVKIEYLGETKGDFVTYDYTVTRNKVAYNVQVTKRQGVLLTMSGFIVKETPNISTEKAQEIAINFASKIGFENMVATWEEVKDNIAYINLAPVQNEVVLYPDLVKVKVDLFNQNVVGFEARNYAFNHTERNTDVKISLQDAEKELGFDYKILNTRKAVIALEDESEVVVYEFCCDRIDGLFYYYVNATTGKLAKILKVVDSNGTPLLV